MSEILFIRHAQASFGSANYDQLSPLGIKQSQILGDFLLSTRAPFDAIYSGSMRRHVSTAKTVMSRLGEAEKLPGLRIVPELSEFDSTEVIKTQVPGMVKEDPSIMSHISNMYADRVSFQKFFELSMLRWISGKYDISRVETWSEFVSRVGQGVERIRQECGPGKSILCFTSGGAMGALLKLALNLPDEAAARLCWQIRNASISVFKYTEDQFSLCSFNTVSHFELERDRELITYR